MVTEVYWVSLPDDYDGRMVEINREVEVYESFREVQIGMYLENFFRYRLKTRERLSEWMGSQ